MGLGRFGGVGGHEGFAGGITGGITGGIKQFRKERGWSQADLGEAVGSDSQRISRYENGRLTPSIGALVRLAETLDASLDYLVIDGAPRRPLTTAAAATADAAIATRIAQLDDTDRQTITNTIDAVTNRNKLRTIIGGSGQ